MLTIVDSEDEKKKLHEIPYHDIREVDPKYSGYLSIKRMAHGSLKIKVGKTKQDGQRIYDDILKAFSLKQPITVVSFDEERKNRKARYQEEFKRIAEKRKNEPQSNR